MKEIYVVVTMDCERPNTETHISGSGPPDYERAEAWTRAYVEIANRYNFPVTFFIHPEMALAQTAMFDELESAGACLGLHVHPWRFGDGRYKAELGGLLEAQARAVLSEATALWQHALGKRPLYFRPGAISANDRTYQILIDLGFRGGSVSMPGRVYPDIHAIWSGAVPDPHRAHPFFRQLEGNLEFANMPMSADMSKIIVKNGRWFHLDLRPDFVDADFETIAQNIVNQVKSRNPAVPVINMVTHNDHDFTDPNDPVGRNFERVLKAIIAACEAAEVRPLGTTIDKVCDLVFEQPIVTYKLNYASGNVIYQDGPMRQFELL